MEIESTCPSFDREASVVTHDGCAVSRLEAEIWGWAQKPVPGARILEPWNPGNLEAFGLQSWISYLIEQVNISLW